MYEKSYTSDRGEAEVDSKCRTRDHFVGAVTVGERGQVVIPSEARKKLGIQTGDRLLIMCHPDKEGLALFKMGAVREFLEHLTAGLSLAESEDLESDES